MIVDDEQDLREMLDLMFRKEGFETIMVEDEQDFLKKIDKYHPDIITLDLMTLGIFSRECLDVLKVSKSKNILLITDRYSETEKQMIHEMINVVDYVTKPIDIDDLMKRINKMVGI
jgi:DNA-binding response OmpR family regulator